MSEKFSRRIVPLLLAALIGLAVRPAHASVIPDGADLWFSSSTPTISFKNGFKYLGPGSVLSVSGKVIATNQQLLADFQPRWSFPMDRGLDAMAITGTADDKTIVFSTNRSFYSNALKRTITDGDLITNKGELLASNQSLLGAFQPQGANFGLDAAFLQPADVSGTSEIWFSTDRSFFSQTLDSWVSAGDIVSNQGTVVARAADLLAPFSPRGNTKAVGVDSLYVDQRGDEDLFWFSTNKDFYSKTLKRWISAADLISSDGTIVMTQKELTGQFGFVYPICGQLQLDAATFFSTPENPPEKPKPPITPEPATLSLLLIGGLLGLRRRLL